MSFDPARAAVLFDRIEAAHVEQGRAIAELRAMLAPPARQSLGWLNTAELGELFVKSPGQMARLCRDGKEFGIAGIEKDDKGWRATADAMREVWARKGRR